MKGTVLHKHRNGLDDWVSARTKRNLQTRRSENRNYTVLTRDGA